MFLIPIRAFADSYLQLLHDGKRAMVVDQGDAGPVKRALKQHAPSLESILVTHHHADHAAGRPALPGSTARELTVKPFPQMRQATIMASTRRPRAPVHDDDTALAAIRQ